MKRPLSLTLVFVGLTVLQSFHYSSPAIVRANPSQECAKCGDRATSNEHTLLGSCYNIRDFSASLILNNKGPNPLLVRPTVFSPKGDPLDLAPFELHGVSAKTLDIARLLAANGHKFREGSLELFGVNYIDRSCCLMENHTIPLPHPKSYY